MAITAQRVVAGPGIVRPGMHIEYLPGFRPGPHARHCHGGTILSIGSKTVRWLPYGWHRPLRTPHTAMRIDVGSHLDRAAVRQSVHAGRFTTATPQWCVWSLAQHLDYAAAHNAPNSRNRPRDEVGNALPDEERPLLAPGVVKPGWHIEYLPSFRPGPHTRHAFGGVIVSVGPKAVTWRPHGSDMDVCTPLSHMRISAEHIPTGTVLSNALTGRQRQEWYAWSLAQHLAHTAEESSPQGKHTNADRHGTPTTAGARAAHDVRPAANKQLSLFSAEEVIEPFPRPAARRPRSQHAAVGAPSSSLTATPAPPPARRPLAEPIVVVPCAASKLNVAAEAGKLYTGSYHKACRAAAEVLTAAGGTVLVLSARYGFLLLDQVIEPYELRMGDPDSITAEQLRIQARALGVEGAKNVTVLAGAAYTAAARSVWSAATAPLTGLGIGRQLQTLVRLRTKAAVSST